MSPSASLIALTEDLGSREAAWDAVLATVAAAHGLAPEPVEHPALMGWRDPDAVDLLGAAHASTLVDRGRRGAFYTPARLVDWLLERALDEAPAEVTVLDPSCGAGNILLAALRRLGPTALERLHGVDLDPVAVAITRLRLRVACPQADPVVLESTVRVGDGLGEHQDAPYDAVVGNPPFLGRLRTRTATLGPTGLGAYTDASAVFLHRALELVRPGGTVALVQPWSFLAARDAGPVRAAAADRGSLVAFWASHEPVFAGTDVATCVPVLRLGARPGPVPTWAGPVPAPGPAVPHPGPPGPGEWGGLVAPALGVPAVVLERDPVGRLGDLGPVTADFRDQYYDLVPHVREHADLPDGARLVTAGLVDPAQCRWGAASTRFARRAWRAPVVDLGAVAADPRLAAWAAARRVPKVLLAPQGRVLEAVVDESGDWLPSVPVVTLSPPPDRLWHALAVLLAPPVVAEAATRYAGTGLTATSLRLSARQVAALPLPADRAAWDDGARLARAAQHASPAERPAALRALGARMGEAYREPSALSWWCERLPRR